MAETRPADTTIAEHAALKQQCDDLHEMLCQGSALPATAKTSAKELCQQVFEHFRNEEAGYLREVARQAPWLADTAAELQSQHSQLRQALSAIVAQLNHPQISPLDRKAVSAAFDDFVLKFQEHEQRENQLLQEAFDRDVGNKD